MKASKSFHGTSGWGSSTYNGKKRVEMVDMEIWVASAGSRGRGGRFAGSGGMDGYNPEGVGNSLEGR